MSDKSARGFDDQFDDGLFRTARHNTALSRPDQWPKSVSEMGGKTSYREQGGAADEYNEGLFRAGAHNTALTRPGKWPKSVSEMRGHTSYTGQGLAPDHEDARNSYVDRRAAGLAPDRGRWVWVPSKMGWVWVE